MGLLTDFFLATPAEIERLDLSHSPVSKFTGLQAKNIDPLKIVLLQCCIDGSTFEEREPLLDEMSMRDAGEEGPWIFQVPQILCDALASAGPADVESYGKDWAATEEWSLDSGREEEIVVCLKEIAKLATQARAEGKQLYLWMCL